MTITVLYSCPACGLVDAPVTLPERAPDEDVLQWMETVVEATSRDHRRRSPDCHPQQLRNLKIPLPAGTNQRIGTTTRH